MIEPGGKAAIDRVRLMALRDVDRLLASGRGSTTLRAVARMRVESSLHEWRELVKAAGFPVYVKPSPRVSLVKINAL